MDALLRHCIVSRNAFFKDRHGCSPPAKSFFFVVVDSSWWLIVPLCVQPMLFDGRGRTYCRMRFPREHHRAVWFYFDPFRFPVPPFPPCCSRACFFFSHVHLVPQGGGAIDNNGVMKFLKKSLALFRGNRTYDSGDSGGQVHDRAAMECARFFISKSFALTGLSFYSVGAIERMFCLAPLGVNITRAWYLLLLS